MGAQNVRPFARKCEQGIFAFKSSGEKAALQPISKINNIFGLVYAFLEVEIELQALENAHTQNMEQ